MMYKNQTMGACRSRRFAVTDKDYMGLVPDCSEVGDEVHVLSGATVPFILRHRKEKLSTVTDEAQGRVFLLVGDAYIHGVMEGEAAEAASYPDD